MSYSALLQVPLIAESQSNKYQTHNDGIAALEQAANSKFVYTAADASNITVTATDFLRNTLFKFSGHTAAKNVSFPSTTDGGTTHTERKFTVWNAGTFNLTLKASTGSGEDYVLQPGHVATAYLDYEDLYCLADADPSEPLGAFDPGTFIPDKPSAGGYALLIPTTRPFMLPVNLTGSQGACDTNPTTTADFSLKKNTTVIGTISFDTAGVCTFTMVSAQSFAIGDILSIVNPGTQDATLANVGILLKGMRL